ncbi:Putative epoxide hydrolase-like protein [Cladobotryum mycophilum]|uniref:Epoxide hydrolase-like protein n=1 Tax=Cladobotryum mycophilum TaxID=491253 RepID=A0ABR0SNH6_9HYPO
MASEFEPYPAFGMSQPAEAAAAAPDEEIKEYKIHVSSKYLDLTRQKLELTRLPRDIPETGPATWWNPKSTVEPLIDFWLEQFSWRDQENEFNTSIPQFRAGIQTSFLDAPLRVHFLHSRSRHHNAVPLLLIPPFPFTNLSMRHLIEIFTNPDDADNEQSFHLVIPSLPGLGFSDALPNSPKMIPIACDVLDSLMKRLGYNHYVTTNSGSAIAAPVSVDWKIANHLATHYPGSCLGTHFISPPLKAPKVLQSPIAWMRWKLAAVLHASILGYARDDFSALRRNSQTQKNGKTADSQPFRLDGLHEPNTLAYGLCDSPTGLLVYFLGLIRTLSPDREFSPSEIITLAELTWLPGPEGTIRLWASCVSAPEETKKDKPKSKPKVAITVFLGDEETNGSDQNGVHEPSHKAYACPAWGSQQYNVVWSDRVAGKPGLLAWDKPQVIANGARRLAKAILAVDKRLNGVERMNSARLEQVVVEGDGVAS